MSIDVQPYTGGDKVTLKTAAETVGDPADAAVADEAASGTAIAVLKKCLYFLRIGGLETANVVRGVSSQMTNTTAVSLIAAGGSGVKNALSGVVLSNTSAVATEVEIQDGSGGTVMAVLYVPASAQSGANFPTALYGTANTAIYVKCRTTAAAVTASGNGWKE